MRIRLLVFGGDKLPFVITPIHEHRLSTFHASQNTNSKLLSLIIVILSIQSHVSMIVYNIYVRVHDSANL